LPKPPPGEITRFSIVIWMVAACAETGIASVSAVTIGRYRLDVTGDSGGVFGMLLVALENLETGLQHD
jgi:hypothetical protein